jgi:quercetin dioxygenase-like cupin family protein
VFQVGEEERELGEGEIALAGSGQKHGVKNRSNERLTVLVYMAPKPAH